MGAAGLIAIGLFAAAPAAYQYRTADGVEHYVGELADVPEAFRSAARPVDLSGVSLDPGLERGLEAAARTRASALRASSPQGWTAPIPQWLPDWPVFVAIAAVFAFAALLLHRLHRGRIEGNVWVWRSARTATWLTGVGIFLVALRLALPHLETWKKQVSHFGFDALVAEEERNSDVMHRNIEKAELKAAGLDAPDEKRPPPSPFWTRPPPPPGLLHH